MSTHRLAIGVIALLGVVTASAASPAGRPARSAAPAAGAAPLMAFGGRSAGQIASGMGGKLDATLAELAR
ncbi:MAG TPA: hypothetical protein VFK87_07850, partial [Steroidobacteraceae bacterium]|nr:hypothetical protein [Steroidobacteraceae bacterium]